MTDRAAAWSLVLHSTWTGIVLSSLGALLLAALGLALLITSGPGIVSVVVTLAGIAAAAVVALDMPVASEFSADGVTRRMMARRQHLPWSRVTALGRRRTGLHHTRPERSGAGLVARVGKRSYLLVDGIESRLEFDELRRGLGEQGELLGIGRLRQPPERRSPTWMYRRRRWRPESAR